MCFVFNTLPTMLYGYLLYLEKYPCLCIDKDNKAYQSINQLMYIELLTFHNSYKINHVHKEVNWFVLGIPFL